jgi:hypothetical protein
MTNASPAPKPLDLLDGLPEPTPDAIRHARTAAGQSQAAAAASMGLGGVMIWSKYERGIHSMTPAVWALYLLSVGLHPNCRATRHRGNAEPKDSPATVEMR